MPVDLPVSVVVFHLACVVRSGFCELIGVITLDGSDSDYDHGTNADVEWSHEEGRSRKARKTQMKSNVLRKRSLPDSRDMNEDGNKLMQRSYPDKKKIKSVDFCKMLVQEDGNG
jgi:hypothetical protein